MLRAAGLRALAFCRFFNLMGTILLEITSAFRETFNFRSKYFKYEVINVIFAYRLQYVKERNYDFEID